MTAPQRRPAFRLKWGTEDEQSEGEPRAETNMLEPTASGQPETTPAPGPPPTVEPSDQFLDSLTSAMRRVADDARETSLSDARAAVAGKVAHMRATAAAREDELRARAETDVTGIGDWSRAEIVRIEAETQRKIEQRRAQLTAQLDEHERRSAAEIAALEAQVEQYEGELALFFSQLSEITDPDTFIAAARRMPRLPKGPEAAAATVAERGREAAAPDQESAEPEDSHEDRLRSLGIQGSEDAEASAEPEPASGDGVEPEVAVEASADAAPPTVDMAGDVVTTTVAAVGLGSFGAVTSFKTAIEKTEGVSSVRLSLGSGGEFVYTVAHRTDLDLPAVVASAHPGASVQRSEDGVLHLTAGKRH